MNKGYIFLVLLAVYSVSLAQVGDSKVKQWLNKSFGFHVPTVNISEIFMYDSCSYIGVLGDNYQKIFIKFDTIYKITDSRYEAVGKSFLYDTVNKFRGKFYLNKFEIVQFVENELWLAVTGKLILNDFTEHRVFEGYFRKEFIFLTDTNKLIKSNQDWTEYSDQEGFAGVWYESSDTTKKYQCLFGFHRYPTIFGDFDVGGSEPIINPKYRKNGWNSHFSENGFGTYQNLECDIDWWK